MVNSKRLIQMLRKWHKMAAIGRKRITDRDEEFVTDKGHFIVYTMDKKRFMIPLEYLRSKVFSELFRISEEEFGLPCNGPITLACDAIVMDYIVSLVGRSASKDLEKALCLCLASSRRCCSSSSVSVGAQSILVRGH
ncbi:hypothetical protein ACHQM5_024444 [Ranunculus cassubicifolius]